MATEATSYGEDVEQARRRYQKEAPTDSRGGGGSILLARRVAVPGVTGFG